MVIIRYAIALLLLLGPALQLSAFAAEITVRPDRNPVSLGESFQLVFESTGSVDDDPDFSPLEQDFDILGTRQSSNLSIINGQMSRKRTWNLTLMAKRSGLFTVPSISFGSDASAPLHLTVKEAPVATNQTAGDLFLEVEAEPKQVYVQGQVLYTARLFHRLEIGNASLSEPELVESEALIEKLGDDSSYETSRDGKRYRVVERRYAIFPQQTGRIRLAPLRFEGQVAVPTRSRFGMFDPMMQIKRVESAGIDLNVLPPPAAVSAGNWLPAKAVKLVEEWPQDPSAFTVGEPLTLTLTLAAEGLTAAQLPVIEPPLPEGMKGYPDQPVMENRIGNSGIVGIRQEKTALIPTRTGRLVLPAIEVPWWNTATGRMETARIEERLIEVQPAAGAVAASPVTPKAPAFPPPAAPAPSPSSGLSATTTGQGAGLWPWLALVMGTGWAATACAWLWSHRSRAKKSNDLEQEQFLVDKKTALGKVKEGCRRGDAQLTKEGLLAWGRLRWPENPPASLGEIASRCGGPLEREIRQLNETLYGRNREDWQGSSLWTAFGQREKIRREKSTDPDALEPLYRS